MKKYLNKFYDITDKVGKHNFILIIFIFVALISAGLYQTFSMYSESEGLKVVNGLDTYSFILNANNETNSVTIAAGSSKYLDITVTNASEVDLKYGLYYSSIDTENVIVGYKDTTTNLPSGIISGNTNYYVTVRIINYSEYDVTIDFGVKFGFENGGELILDSNQYWVDKFPLLLSEVEAGSYVNYIGNNDCYDKTCDGKNLNYIDSMDMGYCHAYNSKYKVSGWRVAYEDNDSAFLISAGAPECLCVMADGTTSDTYCGNEFADNWLSSENLYILFEELNNIALKYCNSDYAKGGVCDEGTAWALNADDFQKITANELNLSYCYNTNDSSNMFCEEANPLIDNGGYYWIANSYKSLDQAFSWDPVALKITSDTSQQPLGVRPVLYLEPSIVVIGGTGTYEDPYIISNRNI